MEFFNPLFSSNFLPHGTCYLWNPKIVWLHVISDGVITFSYYCIPLALIYLVRKRRDIPFNWIFWMFGLFILGCGTTHLMEVWTIWHPTYLLSGIIKAITAAVSIATAIVLLQLLPKAIALPGADQLYGLNQELERQVDMRARREQKLTNLIEELELRVQERTAELDSINESLEREIAIGVEAPRRRWAMAGTVVALLATGFMGFLCWRSVVRAAKDADWVAHTQEVRSFLEATLRHVDDVETGTRAFEVRGEDSFLKPYLEGQRAVPGDIQVLRALVADNPSQEDHLTNLESQVNFKIEYSRKMVAERRRSGKLATPATFSESDRLMTQVRDTVALMDEAERSLLQERRQESLVAQRRMRAIIVFTTLASAIFLLLAGSAVSREAKLSAQLGGQLKKTNADLEYRVEQRTSALQESEARLGGIIESAKDAILTIDEEQQILLFNGAAEKMFGCEASAVVGHSLDRLIPERFRAAHASHIHRFGDTGVTARDMGAVGQLWGLRTDGTEFPIEASISQTEAGGRKLFTVILRDITERKQADEVHERLAAVVQSSEDGIITKSLDGTIIAWNPGAEKLFGYSPSEAVGKSMRMLMPPGRAHEESEILARIKRGESVDHLETVRVRKDGKQIDISVTISPLKNSDGVIIGASSISRDITERKRAEHALSEQAKILDLAQVMVRDTNGHIVLWNLGAEKLYGYTREEALGRLSHELLQTEFPEQLEQIEEKLARDGTWEGELVHRKRDGTHLVVASVWVLHRDEQGRPVRILEANTDITARKHGEKKLASQTKELARQADELARAQQALEAESLMLRLVLDSMTEGLVAVDENCKFVIWNSVAKKILGLDAADIPSQEWTGHYGLYMADMVTAFPTDQLPLVRAIRGESSTTEMFVRNPELANGKWIEVTAGPLRDKQGAVRGGVAAFRDVSQRRADEQEIRKLNNGLEERVIQRTAELEAANKELEAFTYTVSHDLRAPLRHIAGFSKMLADEAGVLLPPEAQHYLQRIQDGTRRMGTLVDDLLNLARIGRHELRLQVTGLDSVVKDVITDLAPDMEGRKIEWKIGKLPYVEGDPALLKVVFQNLLSNAVKYTRPRADAIIAVSVDQVDGEQVVCVRDNGVGFNMNYADKLFGVFQRLHRAEDFEGTGVGLATVQRIVKKHGGRIWAQAELDKGAAFYISLRSNAKREKKSAMAGEIS